MDEFKTYTIPQAAKLTGIPESTLYKAHRAGELKAGKRRGTKRGLRVTVEAIKEFWKGLEESEAKENADQAKA